MAKQRAGWVLALWLFIFAAYSNSFTIDFQFDDTHTVQSNIFVRSLKYIPTYFTDARTFSYRPENSGYRPMSTTAMALGFQLSNTGTWGYHLIKLIEHCIVATMIFFLALRLLPQSAGAALWSAGGQALPSWFEKLGCSPRFLVAWFSGLVFGVHRANTETVNYITAISSLQAGMFYILAFLLYMRWRRTPKIYWFALSLVTYLAGMMSKEEAVTLPAMIFLYDWAYYRESKLLYRLKVTLPYALTAVLFVALRTYIQPAEAELSRGNISTFVYFITQFRSWLYYWKLFFWPVTLNADNLAFDFSPGLEDWRVWVCGLAHLSIWFGAYRLSSRWKFVPYMVAWVYITILPASSVFALVEAVNEHRMYIPYMGLSILAVWGSSEVFSRILRRVRGPGMVWLSSLVVVSLALGIGSFQRNKIWQTPITLWEDIIAKNPESPRAMNVLGVSYLNVDRTNEGLKILERCHEVAPTYLPCIVHLGLGYSKEKRYNEGLAILKQGHELDPGYPHINFHLGIYYKDYFGDFENARKHFVMVAEKTAGRMFQAVLKLADMDFEEGKIEQGMKYVNFVLNIDKSNAEAWESHAKGLIAAGRIDGAVQVYQKLLKVAPEALRFVLGMANVSERKGDLNAARSYYQNAVTLTPDAIQAWMGLARVTEKMGDGGTLAQARAKSDELLKTKRYTFIPSMFFLGDKPRMVKP